MPLQTMDAFVIVIKIFEHLHFSENNNCRIHQEDPEILSHPNPMYFKVFRTIHQMHLKSFVFKYMVSDVIKIATFLNT